ncbi:MAG TPA: hypothetical protein ENN57_03120 [Chloroflexi bacterium]|nr:hypothetical protein [Chloroflexota bacterium]
MEFDWTWVQAWQITYRSIGLVLVILIILTLVTWLIGAIIRRTARRGNKAGSGSEKTKSTQ